MDARPAPLSPDFDEPRRAIAPGVLLPAIAVLFFSLVLTIWVWRQAEETEIGHARQMFDLRTHELSGNIAERLQSYHQVLRGGVGLFAASNEVNREEWRRYVGQLNLARNFPGILALGVSRVVPHDRKAAFVRAIRAEGFPDFDIFPPGDRDSYSPVTFVEPFSDRNRRAFGYDNYSDDSRRQAQDRARDSGETVITGRVMLLQGEEGNSHAGLLMFSPIYTAGMPLASLQERRAALSGFVVGVFEVGDLMAGILGRSARDFDLHIYDGDTATPETLLYDSDSSQRANLSDFTRSLTSDIFGRRWTIQVEPTSVFQDGIDLSSARLVLYSGMALSVMLFAVVWALLIARSLAISRRRALTETRQASLALKESHAAVESAKALLQNIVDNIPFAVFAKDPNDEFRVIQWNKGAEAIFGLSHDSIIGRNAHDLWPPAQADAYLAVDRQVMSERRVVDVAEEPSDTPARGRIYLHTRKLPLFGAGGKPSVLLVICEDITQHKRDRERLELAAKVFANSSEGIVITDAANRIVSVNRAFTEITGYSGEELLGQDPRILSSHRQDKAFYERMWAALLSVGRWQGEVWDRRKDGEVYPKWLTIDTVKDASGEIVNFVAVSSDISERIVAEEKLRFSAEHDSLTGLPNRVLLADRFAQAAARAVREGGRIGLLFVDLDYFKQINDTLGHAIGDLLLQQVSERMTAVVRASDTVTRIGGDEFIVMLPDIDSERDAVGAADQLLAAVREPYNLAGQTVGMSFSVGVCVYPEHGQTLDALVRCADIAMYTVKQSGRDRSCLYSPELEVR